MRPSCWNCNPRRRSRATCITRRWRCTRAARLPGSCSRHRCWPSKSPHWNWRQAASERNSRAVCSSIPGHTLNPEYPMSAVAENIQTGMPAPILFTDSAAAKVAQLIAEEGNPELKLRVFVQGGGCSGFQYGFTFDEITNEDDEGCLAGDRCDELPVPGRRRDRLQGRPAGRAVRHQEPERDHHLRLRFELFCRSAARPPEGAHTVAEGEGIPSIAARPPEGAHTVAEGEGIPMSASAGPVQRGYTAPSTRGPAAPVTPGRLPGAPHSVWRASQAKAAASTCSAGRPRVSVATTRSAGLAACRRCIR